MLDIAQAQSLTNYGIQYIFKLQREQQCRGNTASDGLINQKYFTSCHNWDPVEWHLTLALTTGPLYAACGAKMRNHSVRVMGAVSAVSTVRCWEQGVIIVTLCHIQSLVLSTSSWTMSGLSFACLYIRLCNILTHRALLQVSSKYTCCLWPLR